MLRHRFHCILALATLILAASCASTQGGAERETSSSTIEVDPTLPLRDQLLRLPGVYMNEQGDIRIRGASGPPLYVVDGIETVGDPLGFINTNDVDRMEVLKGPETAIYGVRGGRGVILITTKRGPEPENGQ